MTVFWEHGYEATSTDDLIRAMGIGRQSMYDAFGDKLRLYLEAFQLYEREASAAFSALVAAASSPFEAIRRHLDSVAEGTTDDRSRGCFLVNATTGSAPSDSAATEMVRAVSARCMTLFEGLLKEAKRLGELDPSLDEHLVANYLISTMNGLRVSAKAGVPPEDLRGIVSLALSRLEPR